MLIKRILNLWLLLLLLISLTACASEPEVIINRHDLPPLPSWPPYPDIIWQPEDDRVYLSSDDGVLLYNYLVELDGYQQKVKAVWQVLQDK